MPKKTPAIPSTKPSVARRAVRWGVIVVLTLAAALWIDFARQALATDRVQWQALSSPAELTAPASSDAETPAATLASTPAMPAAAADRPRLLYFTADWCPPCRLLKANVFSKTEVADEIHARFMPYVVDLTRPTADQQTLAQTHGIQSIPTLLIVDHRGTVLSRHTGTTDVQDLLTWLDAGWKQWHENRPAEPSDGPIFTLNQPLP